MTTHATQTTTEHTGFCAECTCGWLKWAHTKAQAAEFARLHRPREER